MLLMSAVADNLVGVILCLEVLVVLLLLLPLPQRLGEGILRGFGVAWRNKQFKMLCGAILLWNVVSLVSARLETGRMASRLHTDDIAMGLNRGESQQRMFSAQYTAYLNFGSILFLAILWGLHSLLQQYFGVTAGAAHDPQRLQALRAEVETKTQQAAQIDALLAESRELDRTYDALLDENPNLRAAARQRK